MLNTDVKHDLVQVRLRLRLRSVRIKLTKTVCSFQQMALASRF